MDNLTSKQRSKNMKAIKSKDTKIEIKLRKALWHRGWRYRKNYSKLPGKPDIVFLSAKVVIFCDSEFFHGYNWEERKSKIKTNRDYWIPKIEKNIERDLEITRILETNGWIVLRFWGNDIKKNLEKCIIEIEKKLTHS